MDYPDGPGDHQLFCCAQVPLESGDVLLVGGNYWEGVSPCTVATDGWASLYDRETQLITRIADIPFGQPLISDPGTTSYLRYYPTATRLPNGHILVTGGDCWDDLDTDCQIDGNPETIFQKDHAVYVPGSGWIPDEAESILDNTVNYDAWNDMPYYPRYHVLPCGLFFGGQVGTGGQVSEVWPWGGTSKINNTRVEGYRGEGACIVASLGPGATDPVRIAYAGGGGGTAAEPQLTNAERITYTYSGGAWSSTGWSATGAMQSTVGGNPGGRFRADGVLLPDGQVLIVGGRTTSWARRSPCTFRTMRASCSTGPRRRGRWWLPWRTTGCTTRRRSCSRTDEW